MKLAAFAILSVLAVKAPSSTGGEVLWQATLPGRPWQGCDADAEVVIAGVSHVEKGKGFGAWLAWDTKTGKQLWHTKTRGLGVGAPPKIAGDVVIVGHGSFGKLQALERRTGKVVWTLDGNVTDMMQQPLVDGREVWLSFNGGATAVDPSTGARRLTIPLFAGTEVLAVDARRVFIHDFAANLIRAFDKQSGTELWRIGGPVIDKTNRVAAGFQPDAVGLDDTSLYVPTNVAETWAIDVATGQKRWGFEPEGGGSFGVVRDGAWLFLASSTAGSAERNSFLQRIEASNGTLSWRRELEGPAYTIPVVTNDLVLIATEKALLGYGTGDGETRLRVPLREPSGPPCVAPDGTLYVAHQPRKLTAVRLKR